MKTNTKKLVSTPLLIIVVLGIIGLTYASRNFLIVTIENDFIKMLKEKFLSYIEQMPEDRVYLQFDKTFYKPGETIWFSAYLRNATDMKPSLKSDILHVELIGPKGNVEKEIKLIAKNGKVTGDFGLEQNTVGGIYKVKAYTNWQKNEADTAFFEKEIQVQDVVLPNLKMKLDFERKAFGAGDDVIAKIELNTNENQPLANYNFRYVVNLEGDKFLEKQSVTGNEGIMYIKFKLPKSLKLTDGLLNVLIDYQGQTESISRSIPIVLNNIKLTMYPEGGDLINGLESKVAFRTLNEFNKPADVEGVVLSSSGKQITSFSSYHQGMGAFSLKPEPGENYFIKITKPEGIDEKFNLPEALPRGFVLSSDNTNPNELALSINSTEKEELSIVAQVRGKIYYASTFNANVGNNMLIIPTDDFPIGVAQVTLFDCKGIERAERLAFVNKNKQLNISVETDKEKYLPREKVKMTITTKDDRGMPMPADISLAVVNDQLLSFADDKSGNILSQLLLEHDIKGKVEEPAFYFSKEPKADKALDYLMMTAGWRRFKWEKILNNNPLAISYQGEKAVIAGTVMDYYTMKPIEKAKINVNNSSLTVQTDKNGQFTLYNIDLTSPAALLLSANGYQQQNEVINEYNQNLVCYLYHQNYYGYGGIKDDIEIQEDFRMMEKPVLAQGEALHKNYKKADDDGNNEPPAIEEIKFENKKGKNNIETKVLDYRAALLVDIPDKKQNANNNAIYYRAKEFAAAVYDKPQNVSVRNDFRSTVYWNGNIEIDRSGKKVIEFYNSDDISSFRATVEGISVDGMVGRTEKVYFTQLPFAMNVKVPVEVATEDIVSIPLTLKNNTNTNVTGKLDIKVPSGFKAINTILPDQDIPAGKTKIIYLDYKVLNIIGENELEISFNSQGLCDAFTQKIKIAPKGFPVTASFSGNDKDKEYTINLNNVVDGSITASLTAYPSVVSDLLKGIESILREPYGCFEQTSMTSYPNVMVMDYLKTTENNDDRLLASTERLLDLGYKKLVTFETKENGYEWFGGAPGHEALTAYGLMQFNDMKNVYTDVDQKMIDRTAAWLMSKKDGNGGFKRNSRALDNFGSASEDITNAYIVYALAEAGYVSAIEKELNSVYKKAIDSKDPYQLGLIANALYKANDNKRADKVMELLYSKQDTDGSWTGLTHSVTRSTGKSLTIETTSLVIMAILKSTNRNQDALMKAVEFLVKSRSGYGAFGSTQGTILALKALTEFAKQSKHTNEDGTIEFYVDGKKVTEKSYKAGDKEAITINGLEKYINSGKHDLRIKYAGVKNSLPYSLAVSWNTFMPNSSEECKVDLTTKISSKTVNVGETDRLEITLKNTTNEGLPCTIAIIGIPAGLTAQPWQLKELQEKKLVDYYEVIGNNVIFYYRQMAPSETKQINLDLKAEIPGEYDAPASSAYLYYTNEFKCWASIDRITVKKQNIN